MEHERLDVDGALLARFKRERVGERPHDDRRDVNLRRIGPRREEPELPGVGKGGATGKRGGGELRGGGRQPLHARIRDDGIHVRQERDDERPPLAVQRIPKGERPRHRRQNPLVARGKRRGHAGIRGGENRGAPRENPRALPRGHHARYRRGRQTIRQVRELRRGEHSGTARGGFHRWRRGLRRRVRNGELLLEDDEVHVVEDEVVDELSFLVDGALDLLDERRDRAALLVVPAPEVLLQADQRLGFHALEVLGVRDGVLDDALHPPPDGVTLDRHGLLEIRRRRLRGALRIRLWRRRLLTFSGRLGGCLLGVLGVGLGG